MGSGERKRYIYEEEVRMEIRMMKVKTMVCCVLMMVLALLAGNQSTLGGVKSVAAQESIASVASGVDDLSILVEAVVAAGLLDAVADPAAALTVFAPTNEAFVSLLGALGLDGLGDIPVDLLTDVLLYHVVPAVAFSTDLSNGQVLPTLNGAELVVDLTDGVVIDGIGSDATVVIPDVAAGLSVVHVIDTVLLPFGGDDDECTLDFFPCGEADDGSSCCSGICRGSFFFFPFYRFCSPF